MQHAGIKQELNDRVPAHTATTPLSKRDERHATTWDVEKTEPRGVSSSGTGVARQMPEGRIVPVDFYTEQIFLLLFVGFQGSPWQDAPAACRKTGTVRQSAVFFSGLSGKKKNAGCFM